MWNEQRRDDARSLTVITTCGVLGMLITAGLVSAMAEDESRRVTVTVVEDMPITITRTEVTSMPLDGGGRLYGRVITRGGAEYTGFIRWDRNEGSWTDLLDADKDSRGGSTQSGIRFGHVQQVDVLGRNRADLVLRSGQIQRMGARSTDLGSQLRALTIENATGETVELEWGDFAQVQFFQAPPDVTPAESRLYGTLTTRDGQSFTGYIAWDVDEIYTSDVLDGDDQDGQRQEIAFGSIESISRHSSSSANVVLHTGRQMILDGTNDVDGSISGIAVSDPLLGEVKMGWDAFAEVRFHAPDASAEPERYDGGRPLRGTVVTRSGEELIGQIRWDNDEESSWEMLNGDAGDVSFQVEFGNIARIVKSERGAMVELRDGRTLQLTGSNDVDSDNRGVIVQTERGRFEVDWSDFVELRLEP